MPHEQPSLQIRLLGPLEVMVAGTPVVVDTRKALAIVALVAGEGRPFGRLGRRGGRDSHVGREQEHRTAEMGF